MPRRRKERPGGLFDRPVQLLTITFLVLAIGWIYFVGSVHLHEMMLGAVVVALSTAFCWLIFKSQTLPFDVRGRDLLQVWRVPGEIVKDSISLIAALLRDLFGGERIGSFYRVCGFKSSKRDPILVGRSALAVMYSTMSPNMIVIGIDVVTEPYVVSPGEARSGLDPDPGVRSRAVNVWLAAGSAVAAGLIPTCVDHAARPRRVAAGGSADGGDSYHADAGAVYGGLWPCTVCRPGADARHPLVRGRPGVCALFGEAPMSVRVIVEAVLLALTVLSCWIGIVGMLRMREPMQALHFLSFPACVGSVLLTVAVFIESGSSNLAWKTLLISVMLLTANSVVTHAVARAFRTRELGHWKPQPGDPVEFVRPPRDSHEQQTARAQGGRA